VVALSRESRIAGTGVEQLHILQIPKGSILSI